MKKEKSTRNRISKKRLRMYIVEFVCLVCFLVYIIFFVVIPKHKYKAAKELMASGKYLEAIDAFNDISKYRYAKEINECTDKYIESLNKQTIAIKKEIGPIVDFIKDTIFKGKQIFSQELVVNEENNMLGLCDFSNEYGCLECKWRSSPSPADKRYYDEFKYQLYITSNGRPTYLMVGSNDSLSIQRANITIK